MNEQNEGKIPRESFLKKNEEDQKSTSETIKHFNNKCRKRKVTTLSFLHHPHLSTDIFLFHFLLSLSPSYKFLLLPSLRNSLSVSVSISHPFIPCCPFFSSFACYYHQVCRIISLPSCSLPLFDIISFFQNHLFLH